MLRPRFPQIAQVTCSTRWTGFWVGVSCLQAEPHGTHKFPRLVQNGAQPYIRSAPSENSYTNTTPSRGLGNGSSFILFEPAKRRRTYPANGVLHPRRAQRPTLMRLIVLQTGSAQGALPLARSASSNYSGISLLSFVALRLCRLCTIPISSE